jgi:hypothetical protein
MKLNELRRALQKAEQAKPTKYVPPKPPPPPKPHPSNCPTCNGTGVNPEARPDEDADKLAALFDTELTSAFGRGASADRCPDCNGSGLRLEGKRKKLLAPAAVKMMEPFEFFALVVEEFATHVPKAMRDLKVALVDTTGAIMSEAIALTGVICLGTSLKADNVTFGPATMVPGTVKAFRLVLVVKGSATKKGWKPTAQYGTDIETESPYRINEGDSFQINWERSGIFSIS